MSSKVKNEEEEVKNEKEEVKNEKEEVKNEKEEVKNEKEEVKNEKEVKEKKPKKRGRKPKIKDETADKKSVRKRGRRKKYEIDSIANCRKKMQNNGEISQVAFSNNDNLTHLEQQDLSFGGVNLTIHKSKKPDISELRASFDKKFGMNETEKAPNVLLQERGNKFNINYVSNQNSDSDSDSNSVIETSGFLGKNVEIKEKIYRKKIYKILDSIDTNKEWPEKTNIWCWWCCHPFETMPIPCPIKYDELRNRFIVKGIFCGWSCAAAYSIENYKSLQYLYLFKQFICDSDDNSVDNTHIIPAPSKICLKNFGGKMTINAFRKTANINSNFKAKISTDHISYTNQEILETYNEGKSSKSKKK